MRYLLCSLLLLVSVATTATVPLQYGYKVTDKKPLPRKTFVQGLQILDDQLYLSSGLYGKSRLQRFNFSSGELEAESRVDPRLFAEGLSVLGERIYLLTWKARMLLVYSKDDLQLVERMRIPGQGWGLTHNGEELIYGDGSNRLYFVSPTEHRINRAIRVSENGRPLHRLNELEWIDGRIWANVWKTNRIVIINPANGQVESSIELRGLLPVMERWPETDVLNGIARDPADGSIWVTGKNWPWLYQIELVPSASVKAQPEAKPR